MGQAACGQAGEGNTPLLESHARLHAQDEREASGGVSHVDRDGNTTLQITAIKVVIAAFGWCPWIVCIKEQRSDAERSLVELGVKVAWHAMAQQGFHDPRLVRHTCRQSWAIQPLIGMRLRASNYLRPGRTSREAVSALPTPGPQTTIP